MANTQATVEDRLAKLEEWQSQAQVALAEFAGQLAATSNGTEFEAQIATITAMLKRHGIESGE